MSLEEYIAEQFDHNGYTVKIIQDQDAFNPRKEYDNVGTMVCWHRNYDLGDETRRDNPNEWMIELASKHRPNLEEYIESKSRSNPNWDPSIMVRELLEKHYIMLPLGLYDHSGISMYVGSQPHWSDSQGWDSGQVGWIYCSVEDALKEWGPGKRLSKKAREQAVKYLTQEVETYDQYLTGDVYGYVIETPDGEDVDSCWGFFGLDYCISEAKSNVPEEPALAGSESEDEAFEESLA